MARSRTMLPATAALAAAVLVVTLLAVSPASALSCNNCVDTGDIVAETINSGDIGGNAVRSSEIADGQVYGADIANGAVGPADLHPAAKAAVGSAQLIASGPIASGSTGAFDSFTVNAPAPGNLLVTVTGGTYLDINAAGAAAESANGAVGLCTVSGSLTLPHCGNAIHTIYSQDADNADGINEVYGFSLQRVFTVPAGPTTFYLNGFASGASLYLYGGPNTDGATATAQFFPGLLGMSS